MMYHLSRYLILQTDHDILFIRCGPLSRMWCMRYEAKHSYFKHLARVLCNFKNIAKTLAHHHQQYMCYQMCESGRYLRIKPEYTGGKFFSPCLVD